MFVPVIPKTIINKTIVYSDTVLNIKEDGVNIQVSSIDDIRESELEKCLKIIFENNKDVIFNTIQYSKNSNTIYFYTNKEINTKSWEDSKVSSYERFNSKEILNEIKNILSQGINTDKDCISLYNVACLMKEMEKKYAYLKDSYEYELNGWKNILIHDFDYEINELRIGIHSLDETYDICFSKQDGDLFITESEYYNNQTILANLGNKLSNLYDEFMKFKDFKSENSYGVKTVNSIFYSNVDSLEVSLFYSTLSQEYKPIFNNGFELTSYSYSSDYSCECNSVNTLSILKGNEDELFKTIFVKIEDMPKWSQDILYKMRNQELVKKEEKNKIKSLKDRFRNFFSKTF